MADLHRFGKKAGRSRADDLLARFDLVEAATKPASTYSGGMRRRLDLAMTLIGSPSVIFLDEPTTGLDPRSRRTMWDTIRDLVSDGVTIFLTTQYLDEADQLADRIGVLDHGRLVAEGTSAQLKARISGGHIELTFASAAKLDAASRMLQAMSRDDDALTLQLPGDGSVRSLRALLSRLDDAGIEVATLSVHTPDLDDVFFALTGQSRGPEPFRPAQRQRTGGRQVSAYTFTDSATMFRRDLRHTIRYPVMLVSSVGVPVVLLLLFAGVFGGAMKAAVAATVPGASYIDYIVPGVMLMAVGYGCSTTALAVNRDMTEGIIARFKTMRIARTSVLTGHVVGAVIRTLLAVAVTVGVSALLGFRPHASPSPGSGCSVSSPCSRSR